MSLDHPPPQQAALFYRGSVMHHRLHPREHRFRYRVFTLLIDLDRLEEAGRLSRLFSTERFNVFSFHRRDHGLGAGDPAGEMRRLAIAAGLPAPSRLLLLCYPRVFGFVFNPIASYFGYDAAGRLTLCIHEVRNTFGDRHHYLCPVGAGEAGPAGVRAEAPKRLYVSPFMQATARYAFRIRPPTARDVALRILESDAGQPLLAASFHGAAAPVTDREVLRLAGSMPFMTLKVVAGIHLEALRLWLKGFSFHHRPKAPPPASLHGTFIDLADARKDPA